MDTPRPEFSYVGEKPCGCVTGAIVDDILNDPDMGKVIGKWITEWKKRGLIVKRVPHEYVREHFRENPCPHDIIQEPLL